MVAPVVTAVAAPLTVPTLALTDIALIAAAILPEVAIVALAIPTKVARVFTAFLPEFATIDLALTEILAIVATIVAQFAAILASFLTEVLTIFATFLAELLTRRLGGSAPVLVGDRRRAIGTCCATLDPLCLPLLANLLALLHGSRIRLALGLTGLTCGICLTLSLAFLPRGGVCLTLRLAGLACLLTLRTLFGARATLTTVLSERCGGDQCGRANQRDQ